MNDSQLIDKLDREEDPVQRLRILMTEAKIRVSSREGIKQIACGLPDAAICQFIADIDEIFHHLNAGVLPKKKK